MRRLAGDGDAADAAVPRKPGSDGEAERDAVAELCRLDELARMRAAASWLQARPQLGREVFVRPVAPLPREGGYVGLMEACLVVLRARGGRPEEAPLYRPAIPELWRVPDALARIRAMLAERPEGGDLAGFLPTIGAEEPDRPLKARAAVASTLMAGLELAREGILMLRQEDAFGMVTMKAA